VQRLMHPAPTHLVLHGEGSQISMGEAHTDLGPALRAREGGASRERN